MKNEELKQILNLLIKFIEKKDYGKDEQKIQYLYNELKKISEQIPTYSKLEELEKIVIDLEVKYDDFNDLSYYFSPLYAKIKNVIHNEEVKKIREENKRKRNLK